MISFYIDAFYITLYLFYSLTATRTPTFEYIKWTPDIDLTGSCFDIVFGKNFRRGMGKKMLPKTRNGLVVASFRSAILPIASCLFRKKREARV